MDQQQSFVIIGAGNVAFHLAGALVASGYNPLQVAGRSHEHTAELARLLNCGFTTSLFELNQNADFYVVAVNDDAIPGVLDSLPVSDKLIFHTSGSSGLNVFGNRYKSYGVFYPLQTFSKSRELDFKDVPVFIEASDPQSLAKMKNIAENISGQITVTDSEMLKWIHVSAVFACNFTNHMFVIAEDLLKENKLSFSLLQPLITETFLKLSEGSPSMLQTGPAVRRDMTTIGKHLKALENHPEYQKIYTFVSQNIQNFHQKNGE